MIKIKQNYRIYVCNSGFLSQIEMAQKLLNSDLAELIGKMKLAQQYVMTRSVKMLSILA